MQPESVSKTTGILKERQIVETTSRSRKGSLKINRSSELVKKESCRGRLIIVEGNIGVGKSTLARKMAKALGYTVFMEPTAENPYLEKFYSHTHTYSHTHSHTHTHTLTHTYSLSHTHSQYSYTHSHTHTHTYSLSHTHTHTHTPRAGGKFL